MNAQVEEALLARFTGAEYQLTNRQSGADFLREMSSGVYLLLAYIFSALFLFILLIIYVRLCDYIEGSRPLIRSLHRLGRVKEDAVSLIYTAGRGFRRNCRCRAVFNQSSADGAAMRMAERSAAH